MQAQLSICTITFNRPDHILALMQSTLTQLALEQCVVEFIILNNGSTVDYSEVTDYIAAHPELKIKYIDSEKNWGVPGGRNILMKAATAPYIFVIDDDVEFSAPDNLIKLNQLFDEAYFKENNVAVIALNVHYFDTKTPQISAFPHKKYDEYKNKKRFLSGHFIGAAHLIKKDAVEAVGYYGEGIFYGMEEYELSFKLIEKGYTIAYDSEVIIYHKESPEGRVSNNAKNAMMWHNKVFVFWKFLPNIYVNTANVLWGLRYLKQSNWDFKGFMEQRKKIKLMKISTPKTPLSPKSLDYLKSVEARLWY